jgi:hypothetical protein
VSVFLEMMFFYKFIEDKVFVVLPQRMGPDVREGRRRQFNYIGN